MNYYFTLNNFTRIIIYLKDINYFDIRAFYLAFKYLLINSILGE